MPDPIPLKAYDSHGKEFKSGLPTSYQKDQPYVPVGTGCAGVVVKNKDVYEISCEATAAGCTGTKTACRIVFYTSVAPADLKGKAKTDWEKNVKNKWEFAKADSKKIEKDCFFGCVCAKSKE